MREKNWAKKSTPSPSSSFVTFCWHCCWQCWHCWYYMLILLKQSQTIFTVQPDLLNKCPLIVSQRESPIVSLIYEQPLMQVNWLSLGQLCLNPGYAYIDPLYSWLDQFESKPTFFFRFSHVKRRCEAQEMCGKSLNGLFRGITTQSQLVWSFESQSWVKVRVVKWCRKKWNEHGWMDGCVLRFMGLTPL